MSEARPSAPGRVSLPLTVAAAPAAPARAAAGAAEVGSAEVGPELVELQFAVSDTGIGIPTDRMDRLFQSFRQVDASTTRTHGGTGLGLAISRHLVDAMGGSMWVESDLGRGSTFHFTVVAPVAAGVTRPSVGPGLKGRRALLVDDNDTRRPLRGDAHQAGQARSSPGRAGTSPQRD